MSELCERQVNKEFNNLRLASHALTTKWLGLGFAQGFNTLYYDKGVILIEEKMFEVIQDLFTWPYWIFLLRLIPTFIIFKYNILGSFLFFLMDANDYDFIVANSDSFNINTYQIWDKFFDQYYLTLQFIIVLKQWKKGTFKKTAIYLYIYRLIGVIAFEVTQLRIIFVFFMNIFEYFFDIVLFVKKLSKNVKNELKASLIIVAILIPIKLYQELFLHSNLDLQFNPSKILQGIIGVILFGFIIYLEFFKKEKKKLDKMELIESNKFD